MQSGCGCRSAVAEVHGGAATPQLFRPAAADDDDGTFLQVCQSYQPRTEGRAQAPIVLEFGGGGGGGRGGGGGGGGGGVGGGGDDAHATKVLGICVPASLIPTVPACCCKDGAHISSKSCWSTCSCGEAWDTTPLPVGSGPTVVFYPAAVHHARMQ